MRDFPDWKIVISSSWREEYSLEALRSFFSPDIAARVVGVTPFVLSNDKFLREAEIWQYLVSAEQQSSAWIALDDAGHFFSNKSNLVLCSSDVGLDADAAEKLRNRLLAKSSGFPIS